MKKIVFNTLLYEEPEGPDKGLPDSKFISITLKTVFEGIVTARPAPNYYLDVMPSLFERCGSFSTFSSLPSIKLKHDSTWDDFSRAYYDSRDFQFTEFHVTLCSVDELRQQIVDWDETHTLPCVLEDEPNSAFAEVLTLEDLVSEHWRTELHDFMERYAVRLTKQENLWTADGHSCLPFKDKLLYLHQLAKLSLSVQNAQTSAASRPCCRSFLMASCRQLSGDDLLGH